MAKATKAAKSNIRKGSKVQFKVGRGILVGKVLDFEKDGKIAIIKSDGRKNITRKTSLLTPANS